MRPPELTETELRATPVGSVFTFDVESFPNYFLIGFRCEVTGKHVFFECSPDSQLDPKLLIWMLARYVLVGFNCRAYDTPMVLLAANGAHAGTLNEASKTIINSEGPWWEAANSLGVVVPDYMRTIDLMEVLPLSKSVGASLKMRAAQMLHHTIQDLPYSPHQPIRQENALEIMRYNALDLEVTSKLKAALTRELELRQHMGRAIGEDLMSKSDAQVGEIYIGAQIRKLTGRYPRKVEHGATSIKYETPDSIKFQSQNLRLILARLVDQEFAIDGGKIIPAPWMKDLIKIGAAHYQMGTGGLHSTESCVAYASDADNQLIDRDVASYYPAIILSQGLYPPQCGHAFQEVYRKITDDRLAAKKAGDKNTADGLKIAINGSIGKMNSRYSILYAPKLLLQVTLTGQLALLMLIERLEAIGVPIVSANTDGIVMLCPHKRRAEALIVIQQWELETGFTTEETEYRAIFSQDVNNYVAVKQAGGTKGKGSAYSNPWAPDGTTQARFMKSPSGLVCIEAVHAFLEHRRPLADTVRACQDPARFAFVRKVKGGAHTAEGEQLGRTARWYRAKGRQGPILTAAGHAVADSEGGRPMMTLPERLPADLDLDWYVTRAGELLGRLGQRFQRQADFRF